MRGQAVMYGCVCKHNSQGLCWGRLGGSFGTFSDHKFIFMSWPARVSSVPAAWNNTRRSCCYFEGLLEKCLLISPCFSLFLLLSPYFSLFLLIPPCFSLFISRAVSCTPISVCRRGSCSSAPSLALLNKTLLWVKLFHPADFLGTENLGKEFNRCRSWVLFQRSATSPSKIYYWTQQLL